ncbi:DNA-binding protein [Paenibacillus chitinolyticus]|uniref:DNA-binding protein n=1 Tax=Paenibacillus chitinolyticus TaxID=79263 RepID=UPI002DBC355D|nr:DNA-binding protein [Paenibacillus chitinolyticus]MEC0247336.1 DNA-binding protein [Paenibacillus chitinolyticus]
MPTNLPDEPSMKAATSGPESDLPAGLSKPALRALAAAGFQRLEQLTRITEKELLLLHGMGPKAIKVLRPALAAKSLSFASESGASGISS